MLRENLKKFSQSGFLKSSLLVSISKVISSLSNLVFMVVAVNLLSRTENGYLQYYLGFLPIVLAIAELGIPSAIVKYLSPITENLEEIGNLMQATLLIKLGSFFVLLMIGIIANLFFDIDILILFVLVVGGTITSFVTYFESILVSYRNYYKLAIWNPLGNIMKLFLLFTVSVYFKNSLSYLDILVIFSFSPIITFGIYFILTYNIPFKWTGDTVNVIRRLKDLSFFNLWAFLASIFAIFSDRMELFFLKQYRNPEAVAIYGTTLQLFSGFVIIFSTFNSLVLPGLSLAKEQKEFNRLLGKSLIGGILLAIFLFPGLFLAEPILTFLFQAKYSESIPIFKILYPNYLLQLLFAPLGIALFAMGKPKILAMLAFIRLVSGVFLDLYLIPEYGITGAGIAFFLGQIISWLVLLGYFWATLWKD